MHPQSYPEAGTTNQHSRNNNLGYTIRYLASISLEKVGRGCFPGKIWNIYWLRSLVKFTCHRDIKDWVYIIYSYPVHTGHS